MEVGVLLAQEVEDRLEGLCVRGGGGDEHGGEGLVLGGAHGDVTVDDSGPEPGGEVFRPLEAVVRELEGVCVCARHGLEPDSDVA